MEVEGISPVALGPVDPRKVAARRTEVLVVGAGVAGLSAALEASRSRKVVVLAKGALEDSNTALAQGGIAAALGPDDDPGRHARDTLEVGEGLAHPSVVEGVAALAPEAIARLRAFGAVLDGRGDVLDLTLEGGHSRARIVHARGDATGKEVARSLLARIGRARRATLHERTFVVDLLLDDLGSCVGALAWSRERGFFACLAGSTVLATGGAGQIYRETTNPPIATGDGLGLALRAGAELRDLEFVQFHPTLLYVAGGARILLTETLRGAGAVLRDRSGRRVMEGVHPDRDLAPRDVVARAIVRRIVETGDTNVYLDLRPIGRGFADRFPSLARVLAFFDLDPARDPVPVRPGAHYEVGGIVVDPLGRTGVSGLFACGEVASSGLHGANRLGSNSLLEGLVLGAKTGETAAAEAGGPCGSPCARPKGPRARGPRDALRLEIQDLVYSIKSLVGRAVAVEREEGGLLEAARRLAFWSRYALARPSEDPREWELANMLLVARLLTQGALARRESRGVHARADHPARDDARFRAHSVFRAVAAPGGWLGARLRFDAIGASGA